MIQLLIYYCAMHNLTNKDQLR